MNEKRRSQRIHYLGSGWLQHEGTPYSFRLENISLHGAMVALRKPPIGLIKCGEKCCLKLRQEVDGASYKDFMARIVRFESSVVGLEFIGVEDALKDLLGEIIKKEQHLADGADKLINLAREVAEKRGIELTDVHFDKGELLPERDIHTLRFFAGKQAAKVHLHRADIEEYARDGAVPTRMKIYKAVNRLEG